MSTSPSHCVRLSHCNHRRHNHVVSLAHLHASKTFAVITHFNSTLPLGGDPQEGRADQASGRRPYQSGYGRPASAHPELHSEGERSYSPRPPLTSIVPFMSITPGSYHAKPPFCRSLQALTDVEAEKNAAAARSPMKRIGDFMRSFSSVPPLSR